MCWRIKQFWTTLVLITFFTTFLPHPLLAEDPAVSLEQAIQTAKELFSVPPSYSDFHSQFSSNIQSKSWVLRWQAPEPETGSLEVAIDAGSGECISMNLWRPKNPAGATGPALSEAEAYRLADVQLKRLLPSKAAALRLLKEPELIYLDGYDQRNYNFVWERYENGIPVLGDGARMEIDSQSREVISYNLDWLEIPPGGIDKAISSEQALKVFQNEKMLQLQYTAPQGARTYGTKSQNKPRLVYTIAHPSNGTINAVTGEPLLLKNGQWEESRGRNESMKSMDSAAGGAPASAPRLSPEEIKELEKNSRFIGQDEAIARVKKWLTIPADAVLNNASLERDWQNQERRVWNLNWNTPATGKGEVREYRLWARVDALNGRIYAFNQYNDEQTTSGITKEAALAITDSFIKQIEPELAGQIKLNEQTESRLPLLPVEKESQSQWDFSYIRLVNNVPFPQQGISITISGQEKKVIGYELNWSEYDFPPADRALSMEEANRVYLQAAPLTLCYTRIYQENSKSMPVLVYKSLPAPGQKGLAMIDAISKEALDAGGAPLTDKPGPRFFSDIKGHWAEKEITLIGSAGLMADYGQQFHPDETINTISFLRALLGIKDGIGSISNGKEDARIMSICQQRGWVKEKIDANAPLTRDYLSRVLVRSMGLERVAQNSAIFVNPYPDDRSIDQSNLGYAALVDGLGLIPSSPAFNSQQSVTRGEAAYALIKSLNL